MEHASPAREKQAEPSTSSVVSKSGDHDSGVAASPVPLPPLAASGESPQMARPSEPWIVRRMAIGGAPTPSSVSGTTHTKHVMAQPGQAVAAQAGYGSRTFVTSDADLTAAVDAAAHDFAATPARSAREDINATVPIYQYDKTGPPPAGLAAGQPVAQSIAGDPTPCEIGAVKTGDGGPTNPATISITHFKKL